MVFQLLWFNECSSFDNGSLSNIPSWSWAATRGVKTWPPEGSDITLDTSRLAEEMPQRLLPTPAGHLQVCGHLSTIQPAPSCVQDKYTARDLELHELACSYGWWGRTGQGVHLLTQDIDDEQDKAVLGIV